MKIENINNAKEKLDIIKKIEKINNDLNIDNYLESSVDIKEIESGYKGYKGYKLEKLWDVKNFLKNFLENYKSYYDSLNEVQFNEIVARHLKQAQINIYNGLIEYKKVLEKEIEDL